jgi:hypothetical protein
MLSEWVTIKEDTEIFETTKFIYPGEISIVERLETCPPGKLLHIAVQFKSDLGYIKKWLLKFLGCNESWATTRIIVNEKVSHNH